MVGIGLDNIKEMSPEAAEQVRQIASLSSMARITGKPGEETEKHTDGEAKDDGKERIRKWKVWDLEFEAQMRMLDNAVSSYAY